MLYRLDTALGTSAIDAYSFELKISRRGLFEEGTSGYGFFSARPESLFGFTRTILGANRVWSFFNPKRQGASAEKTGYTAQLRKDLAFVNRLDFSATALADELQLNEVGVIRLIRREIDPYVDASVPKRNGSIRHLAVPEKTIRPIQRHLLKKVLNDPEIVHRRAYAFTLHRSSIDAVNQHIEAEWLLKLDLKDFFHSIDERMVYWSLRESAVDDYKCFFIARMTTRSTALAKPWLPGKYSKTENQWFKSTNRLGSKRLGYLPQGALTSGAVSNLVAFNLDNSLEEFASENILSYTRYADDLAFSSKNRKSRAEAVDLLSQIRGIIQKNGFTENKAKTRIYGTDTPKKYLGLEVYKGEIRLPKGYKKYVADQLRAIEKFGLHDHWSQTEKPSPLSLLNHLHGKIIWAMNFEFAWAREQMARLEEIGLDHPDLFPSK